MTLEPPSGDHPRLLIADDDAFIRSALSLQLGTNLQAAGAADTGHRPAAA